MTSPFAAVQRPPRGPEERRHARTEDVTSVLGALRDPRRLRTEVLAGLVVALALIPEAISFSIIAGVDPRVGLFASFTMAVSIAFLGGRPGDDLRRHRRGRPRRRAGGARARHGLPHRHGHPRRASSRSSSASLGVARLMRFVPRSVMVGFVNALAILIFARAAAAPDRRARGSSTRWSPPASRSSCCCPGSPRPCRRRWWRSSSSPSSRWRSALRRARPSATRASCPSRLPSLFIPDVPLTLETLRIIAPYAVAMALVGLMESLMTAKLVDDVTDTRSNKTREAWGQGVANVVTGFFGGMGGCAMIGQTMINVKASGARTRISTFLAGVFLLVLVVGLGDVVATIPMAALVAVMVMVSVGTFDWHSRPAGHAAPHAASARPPSWSRPSPSPSPPTTSPIGVVVGVLVAAVLFARRVAHFTEVVDVAHPDERHPRLRRRRRAVLRLEQRPRLPSSTTPATRRTSSSTCPRSHIWDASTVAALDAITTKYAARGKTVTIVGLNDGQRASATAASPATSPAATDRPARPGAARHSGGRRTQEVPSPGQEERRSSSRPMNSSAIATCSSTFARRSRAASMKASSRRRSASRFGSVAPGRASTTSST